jgi:Domain of unknown function (DUF4145)
VLHEFNNLDGFIASNKIISGLCPNCTRHTTLHIEFHERLDGSGIKEGEAQTVRCWMTTRCDWCKSDSAFIRRVKVKNVNTGSGTRASYETITIDQVWPKQAPRELAQEAPSIVREVFAEAALAEAAGAYRLAGIGYRATVEQIVKDKGASGRDLKQRILNLSSTGVPQDIVNAFHEARFVGNDAAHDALAYSAEEIADIAELINEAVLVLYVQPAQRAKMAAQRAARRGAGKKATS